MITEIKKIFVVTMALLMVSGAITPGIAGASAISADDSSIEGGLNGQQSTGGQDASASEDSETRPNAKLSNQPDRAEIAGTLRMKMASAEEGDKIPVIVIFEKRPKEALDLQNLDEATAERKLQNLAESQQSNAKSYLQKQQQRNRAGEVRTFWTRNSMAVHATEGTIEDLAGMPNVERIVFDRKVSMSGSELEVFSETLSEYGNTTAAPSGFEESTSGDRAWSVEYIGADSVQERGVNGEGVNVSVVDTGIDGDHPALDGAVTKWKDFTADNYTQPTDPIGHGTHVAGSIAARPDSKYAVGVAPQANLYGAKVFSENPEQNPTRVSDIVEAFEWSANNSADVISASIGVPPILDAQGGTTDTGSDATAQNDVRVYANASGTSENVSLDAYKPSSVLVIVEPKAVNGTSIQNDSRRAAVMSNLTVTLADPSGNESLKAVNASWAFADGEVPEQIAFRKYKPNGSRPLTADGNWTLTVTSETGKNVTYSYTTAPVYPSNGSDELAKSINTISTTHDVTTVVAAGNYGYLLGNRSVSSPGTASEAITVGATGYRVNDVASFSSRGPVAYGSSERPGVDVIAPGRGVLSTIPTEQYPDTNFARYSGTSMATPHVSGTIALMLSADPTQTPSELESTLKSTAQDVPEGENAAGAGVIDAYRAVNETNSSALGPETTESGRHTLFAGLGNTSDDDIYVDVEPHLDEEGDAGSAPDIWVTSKLVVDNFELATHDDTAPNATFRMYLDTDRDATTGDGAQAGAEYLVVINRTYDGTSYDLYERTYEYDAANDTYVETSKLSVYPGEASARFIELYDISFSDRADTKPFDWHVTSAERGSSPGDRFPNNGQVSDTVTQTINGTAVAWNATAGQPDSGAPVTFQVYDPNGALVSNETVEANAAGRASSDVNINATTRYDDYLLEISDTHGNEIRQEVSISGACIEYCLLDGGSSGLSYTVQERSYDPKRNETLTLNIPVYNESGGNLTKYTGNASILLTNYDNNEELIIDNISVDDGVIRTDIPLESSAIDDRGSYIDITAALEGDFKNASATTDGGDIDLYGTGTRTSLAPYGTTVQAGQSATLSFQNVNIRDESPANVSTEYMAIWITDRDVAKLYNELPRDLVDRIKQRKQSASTGQATEFSAEERQQIRQAVQNLSEQGVNIKTTTGTVAPTARGIGKFEVTPPEDTRFGFVLARPSNGPSEYYTTASAVFVDGRVSGYADKQTEPVENTRYDLEIYADWDTVYQNGTYQPAENYSVSVSLYDTKTGEYVDNATVNLYTTFGQSVTVRTNGTGPVDVTLAAPDRDWGNLSYEFRRQDVLGVAQGYQTADGGSVSERDSIYGSYFDSGSRDGVAANPQISYMGNGSIQTTIEYYNQSTYEKTSGKETVVLVTRGQEYNSHGDIFVGYVDPGTANETTLNLTDPDPPGTDESALYAADTKTADQRFGWDDNAYLSGFSVSVDAPNTITDGGTSTVTFTVTDRNGDPVEDAVVKWQYILTEFDRNRSGESAIPYQVDGDTRVAVTDSNGQATVEVSPDIAESISSKYLSYRVGVATANQSETFASSGSISVEQEQGNVTGRIIHPDGTTVADNRVIAWGYGTGDKTDSDGRFTMAAGDGSAEVVFYQTRDNGTPGTLDGVPDAYALGEVNGPTDFGNVSLPQAHRLNVTVVDEDGTKIKNATVKVTHYRNGSSGGWVRQTNADGQFEIANRVGIETVGNVSVTVTPPDGETRFIDETVVKNLTVTGDDNVTVTLAEKDLVQGRIVYPDNSTVADDVVAGFGWNETARTDSDGRFELPVHDGTVDAVFYQHHDPGHPLDSVPDTYVLGSFNNSTQLGNISLPEAHRLNTTVVTNDGTRVENATVTVIHHRNGASAGWVSTTNANGKHLVGDRVGIEVVGNVTVKVSPPENATGFEDETKVQDLTVTSDRNLTVQLNTTDITTGVEMEPNESNSSIGATTSYDIVVTNASDGVGAYDANVTVSNATVAEIVAVELKGNPDLSTVNISSDNSTVQFDGAVADTNDTGRVVIATVTVKAKNPGETGLGLRPNALGTEHGVTYNITSTSGGTLNVSDIGKLKESYAGPPTDVDNDGVYEDINGDGEFNIVDVQALYSLLDDELVQNNTAAFDINGDGSVDVVDVQALYVEQGGS